MRVRVSKFATGIIPDACSSADVFFTSEVYSSRDFTILVLDDNSSAISLNQISTLQGCSNTVLPITYNIFGSPNINTNYRIELSDINENWQNIISLGTSTTSPINITIPNNLSTSGNYQLRLLSDSPNTYYFQNVRAFSYFNKMESTKSGQWNSLNSWSCGRLPIATDDIYINTGHIIKLENYIGNAKSIFLNGTLQYINGNVRVNN